MALVEKLVGNYNEDLADSIERVEKILGETREGHQPPRLTIDLPELIESVRAPPRNRSPIWWTWRKPTRWSWWTVTSEVIPLAPTAPSPVPPRTKKAASS